MTEPGPGRPVSVVTGASGGIGREVAAGLARAGDHVVLIGRDPARTEAAAHHLRTHIPGSQPETRTTDLALLGATRQLGATLLATHPIIDRLVLNAGVFHARRETTAEGHERVLAVNALSPFVLLNTLLPALQAAAPSHIVLVGSDTSDRARINPDDLELRHGWGFIRAYARSKLILLMIGLEAAERLRDRNISVVVAHPGAVATGLVRTPGPIGWGWRAMAPFLRGESEGAETILHAAFGSGTGQYLKPSGPARPNPRALDSQLRALVWKAVEGMTAAGE